MVKRSEIFMLIKNFFIKHILVVSVVLTILVVLVVNSFKVPNPNVILLTAVVYLTFLGGSRCGFLSGFIVMVYSIYFFSILYHFGSFTIDNLKRIIVIMIFVPMIKIKQQLKMKGTKNMKIRKMTIDDYQAVYQLWNDTAGIGMRSADDSKDGIMKYLDRNPETCFVAESENKIIGAILSGHDGRRGYIYHTAVINTVRKQGIGTKLVNIAIAALKKQGINKVALVAFETNESGNCFWESQGFEERTDLVYRNKSISNNSNL